MCQDWFSLYSYGSCGCRCDPCGCGCGHVLVVLADVVLVSGGVCSVDRLVVVLVWGSPCVVHVGEEVVCIEREHDVQYCMWSLSLWVKVWSMSIQV